MDRRKALSLMGIMSGAFIAKWSRADTTTESKYWKLSFSSLPKSIFFEEDGLKDIIIERSNGKKIIISFSEVFDALEEIEKVKR